MKTDSSSLPTDTNMLRVEAKDKSRHANVTAHGKWGILAAVVIVAIVCVAIVVIVLK